MRRACDTATVTSQAAGEGFAPSPSLDQEDDPSRRFATSQMWVKIGLAVKQTSHRLQGCATLWQTSAQPAASPGHQEQAEGAETSRWEVYCVAFASTQAVVPRSCSQSSPSSVWPPVPPSPLIGAFTWRCCHRRCWCR